MNKIFNKTLLAVINQKSLLIMGVSLFCGFCLFWGIRLLLQSVSDLMIIHVAIEESIKFAVMIITILIINKVVKQKPETWYALPFFIICFFAVTENIYYFWRFPALDIFIRLFFTYFIHINTGLLFLLVVAGWQKKKFFVPFILVLSIAYHYVYNSADPGKFSLQVFLSIINLLIFFILLLQIKNKIFIRSEL